MTTATTPLDNVIEHATESTKAASERAREFAQIGVRKATEGFEQISKAAQTVRHLGWFEVEQVRGHVENGKVKHYQVTLKAGFTLEDAK